MHSFKIILSLYDTISADHLMHKEPFCLEHWQLSSVLRLSIGHPFVHRIVGELHCSDFYMDDMLY